MYVCDQSSTQTHAHNTSRASNSLRHAGRQCRVRTKCSGWVTVLRTVGYRNESSRVEPKRVSAWPMKSAHSAYNFVQPWERGAHLEGKRVLLDRFPARCVSGQASWRCVRSIRVEDTRPDLARHVLYAVHHLKTVPGRVRDTLEYSRAQIETPICRKPRGGVFQLTTNQQGTGTCSTTLHTMRDSKRTASRRIH